MTEVLIDKTEGPLVPIHALRKQDLEGFLGRRGERLKAQAARP